VDEVSNLVIVEIATLRLAEVYGFFSQHTDLSELAHASDQLYPGLGYAARSSTEILGIMIFTLIPSLVAGETLCFISGAVHTAYRRRRVGTRLLTEVISVARKTAPRVVVVAPLPEQEEQPIVEFLNCFSFTEMDTQLYYRRELSGVADAIGQSVYDIREYKGNELHLDESVLDLYRRAYRGHLCIPEMTLESLKKRLTNFGCSLILLSDNGRLVGHAWMWIKQNECYVESLLVARSHWGTGASDALGRALLRLASKGGCRAISGAVASTNRPSRSLMERHGFQVVSSIRRFGRTYIT